VGKQQFGAIRELPSGRYQARYHDPFGVRHAETFDTKADAGTWLSVQQTDLLRGQWVDPRAGEITFEKYATTWLEQRWNLRPRTQEMYESFLRVHLIPQLGKVELGQLTTPAIRAWHAELLRRGRPGKTTVAKLYRLLKTILSTAVEDNLILRNPCVIKGAAVERTPERTPATLEQVRALVEAVDERYRAMFLVATFAGLRWGEIIALTRQRIDVEHGTVRVVEQFVEMKNGTRLLGPPKSAAGVRTVAIPPHILGDIEHHLASMTGPRSDDLVFHSPDGEPMRRSNFNRRIFRPAAAAAGLPATFRFHDLRHTGSTLAASTGASTRELMARMGHASPRAALIYQHATVERDHAIADAISKLVGGTER
jgi:integrase